MSVLCLKSTPLHISKVSGIVNKNHNVSVIALSSYAQWGLKSKGLKSRLFGEFSAFTDCKTLHDHLETNYDSLVSSSPQIRGISFVDLFKNHLCWEIQDSYLFFMTLDHWVRREKATKLIFEPLPSGGKLRNSKSINELIRLYCKKYRLHYEQF